MGTGGLFLRKVRAAVEDEPDGFVWIEKGNLAGSGYPASRSQVERLAKNGIRAILTLTEEPLPKDYLDGLDMARGHVPMKDHEVPSPEALARGVDFVLEQVSVGRPVVVHCLAGEGRTGCLLAAYLIKTRKVGADEALATLRGIKPGFVERRQERSVREYAATDGPRSSN